jgi:hypothetical protein
MYDSIVIFTRPNPAANSRIALREKYPKSMKENDKTRRENGHCNVFPALGTT